jgi:hypothetical protein
MNKITEAEYTNESDKQRICVKDKGSKVYER